jgi:hypothetical protein
LIAEKRVQVLALLDSRTEVEDESRTMVADCLAQLSIMAPAEIGEWLTAHLSAPSAAARGVAVSAMQHALHDNHYKTSDSLTQYAPSRSF